MKLVKSLDGVKAGDFVYLALAPSGRRVEGVYQIWKVKQETINRRTVKYHFRENMTQEEQN